MKITLTIIKDATARRVSVDARAISGEWAVHRPFERSRGWMVSNTRSGLSGAHVKYLRDARTLLAAVYDIKFSAQLAKSFVRCARLGRSNPAVPASVIAAREKLRARLVAAGYDPHNGGYAERLEGVS